MVNRNGSNNGHGNGTGNGLVHINGNGRQHDAARVSSTGQAIVSEHDLLWDGLPPAVTNALGQSLDPALVSQRKGRAGRSFDYLEGHVVIDQANRIFGFGGWGYELVGRRDPAGDRERRHQDWGGEARPRLQRPGAGHRPRRAAPHRHRVQRRGRGQRRRSRDRHQGRGDGRHEAGAQELRRPVRQRLLRRPAGGRRPEASRPAARQQTRTNSGGGASRPQRAPAPAKASSAPANAPALRKRLIEIAAEQGFDEDGLRTAVADRTGKSLDDLTVAELAALVEAAARKLQEAQQAKAA